MPIGLSTAVIAGGALAATGAVVGASMGSSAAKSAAGVQAKSADAATQLQADIYNQNRTDLAPWRAAGTGALQMLSDALGINGPSGNANATAAFQKSPGYDFAFSEGQKAVDTSAAARGMLRSGAAIKAQTRFGQGTADQEFGGWLGKLAGVAGVGQSATNTTAQGATAYAANAGSTMQDAAAARASGYVGASNAVTGGINSLAKLAGNYGLSGLSSNYTAAGGGMYNGQYYAPFDSAAAAQGF